MIKKFLDYLKEAVDLNPILGKDEIPLSFGDENDKILKNRNIKEEPIMLSDYKALRKRTKKELAKKKQKRNRYAKNIIDYENAKKNANEFILQPTTVIRNEKEWKVEVEFLSHIDQEIKNERNQKDQYSENLSRVLKKFFSVGGKIPKRYLYLPLTSSNKIDIAMIEKLNKESKYNVFLNAAKGHHLKADEIQQEIIDYLNAHGYKCDEKSYFKNECQNENGKTIKIDMELNRIQDININNKNKFINKLKAKTSLTETEKKTIASAEKDIERKNDFKDYYFYKNLDDKENVNLFMNHIIVLTWVPRMIMSQSTNAQWISCMRYFIGDMVNKEEVAENAGEEVGGNVHYVLSGIQNGTFIAWLVNMNDTKAIKPVARALMKPYDNDNDQFFFWPSTIYTSGGQANVINLFKHTLQNYAIQKQKDVLKLNKDQMDRFSISQGSYHDNSDLGNLTDVENMSLSQKEKIEKIIKSKTLHVNKIDNIIKSEDYDEKNMIDFINNPDIRSNIFDRDYNDFINFMASFVKNKKYKLINNLFFLFKKNNKTDLFFEQLADFFKEDLESTKYQRNVLDKNMITYILKTFKAEIEQSKVNIFNYKALKINTKLTHSYPKNKTFIDDIFEMFPDFFNGITETDLIYFMKFLKIKTLQKICIKFINISDVKFPINYLQLLFYENDKVRAFFILNNFQIGEEKQSYSNTAYKTSKDIYYYRILQHYVDTFSYDELINFLNNNNVMFNQNKIDPKNKNREFDFGYDVYVKIIKKFNKQQVEKIFSLMKLKDFDIKKMAMDNFDILQSRDVSELYQNADNENVKDFIDDLTLFIKNNKDLEPRNYLSGQGNIQNLIQAQIATDKEINYDFLRKITELHILSLHGNFSKIKTLPNIFYDFKNILLTRKNIQLNEINKIIQISDMYLDHDMVWENIKNHYSVEDKILIFAFLSPEKFKKHYKYLKLSTIFERLTLINNITTSSMTELDDSMNVIKILKKIIKDKIPFEIENSLEKYTSEEDDYGKALVVVRILYEKGLLKKEDIVKNSVFLKELILILFQNRIFKNDKLKSEVFNYYKKILPQENGGNQYHLSMKIMSFIEKINRSIFMDNGKVVEKHDPLKDFIKVFFNTFVSDEEKKEFFRNVIGIILSYHRASKTSTRDYKSIFDMITEYQRDLKITDDDIEEYFLSAFNMAKDIHILKMLLEANFRMDILVNMLNKKDMNYFYNKISNYRNSSRYDEFEFVLKYIDKDKLKEIIEKSTTSKEAKESDYKKMIEVAKEVLEEKQA
jgi:endonuclease III